MLSAYSNNKEIVMLLDLSREKIEQMKEKNYFCPACDKPVRIKNGKVNVPHFAHFNQSVCSVYSEGETIEHLTLKEMFVRWCELESIPYELEKHLPALNQRPDILIGNIAIEIQCSSLSIKRLVERTQSYQQHGYTPLWICGKKLFSKAHRLSELAKNLCYFSNKLGFYLWSADWELAELTLYFHIEEDWKKTMYASKKTWSFYKGSLLDIFQFSDKADIHSKRKYKFATLLQDYYYGLSKKLYSRDEKIRVLQSLLYNNCFHLTQLPNWFYYPGLHIFCCRGSDLLLKVEIWKLVQFFDQNVFSCLELIQVLEKVLDERTELFYELPNISFKVVKTYCLDQLLAYLIDCNHLVRVNEGWKITIGNLDQSTASILKWLKRIENNYLITATPLKNVIR